MEQLTPRTCENHFSKLYTRVLDNMVRGLIPAEVNYLQNPSYETLLCTKTVWDCPRTELRQFTTFHRLWTMAERGNTTSHFRDQSPAFWPHFQIFFHLFHCRLSIAPLYLRSTFKAQNVLVPQILSTVTFLVLSADWLRGLFISHKSVFVFSFLSLLFCGYLFAFYRIRYASL